MTNLVRIDKAAKLYVISAGNGYSCIGFDVCDVELTPALIGLEGKRVEVTAPDGSRQRFRVGRSTGTIPCHIALHNAVSSGGPAIMWEDGSTVRVVNG